ncbi:MAG: OsmC family protein [Burkholderiales bacterium]
MGSILNASVELIGDKMKFKGVAGGNPEIITDYIPPFGDGEGYMPLELFLVSLSTCIGGAMVVLIRKTRKSIESFSISAQGVRRETHPTCFEKITLNIRVKSPDATKQDIEKVLQTAEPICPVLAMIKGNVEVITEVEVSA